jgi:polyisoprenoid-binding protein YceI
MTVRFSCLYLFPFLLFGQTFEVSKSSKITYYGSHYAHDWQGHSSGISGRILYDADDQTANSCSLRVDLTTFDSGNSNRDSNMLTYLNAFQYPDIMFVSNEISVEGINASIKGKLTFHGITKDINLTADISFNDGFNAEGSFIILLSEYEVERPALLFKKIADEMKLKFHIVAK